MRSIRAGSRSRLRRVQPGRGRTGSPTALAVGFAACSLRVGMSSTGGAGGDRPGGCAALAAAVSQAGGLGSLGASYMPLEVLQAQVRAMRRLTEAPAVVNLILAFDQRERLEVAVEEQAPWISFPGDRRDADCTRSRRRRSGACSGGVGRGGALGSGSARRRVDRARFRGGWARPEPGVRSCRSCRKFVRRSRSRSWLRRNR